MKDTGNAMDKLVKSMFSHTL